LPNTDIAKKNQKQIFQLYTAIQLFNSV